MNSCGACGSKVGHDDLYCAFCGMYLMKDGINEKTLGKMIDVISSQVEWFQANKLTDPLVIPTSNPDQHPTVLQFRGLKMDDIADRLEGLFRRMEIGQHRTMDMEVVVDCKPVGTGFASTIKMISGKVDLRLPVFTTDEVLTRNLTKLIVMVLVASFDGLMKERTKPIEG